MAFIDPLIIKDRSLKKKNRLQKEHQTMSENLWKVLYNFMIKTGKLRKRKKERKKAQHTNTNSPKLLPN